MLVKILKFLFVLFSVLGMNSCTTFFGGRHYTAHIKLENSSKASIYYKGIKKGNGVAQVKVKRGDADNLSIVVKEEGCVDFEQKYTRKSLRVSGLLNLGLGSATVIGVVVDACTGSYMKPNVREEGVSKLDYDNFLYRIDPQCSPAVYSDSDTLLVANPHVLIKDSTDQFYRLHKVTSIEKPEDEVDIDLSLERGGQETDEQYYNRLSGLTSNELVKSSNLETYNYMFGSLKAKGVLLRFNNSTNPYYYYSVGEWKYYYKSGNLKKVINYNSKGKKHGPFVRYSESGELLSEVLYRNDIVIYK